MGYWNHTAQTKTTAVRYQIQIVMNSQTKWSAVKHKETIIKSKQLKTAT